MASTADLNASIGSVNGAVDKVEGLEVEGGEAQAIESLCMNCHEQGVTRLLLTSVPHFRDLVLMAFECPHCNYRNNEVQFAGGEGGQRHHPHPRTSVRGTPGVAARVLEHGGGCAAQSPRRPPSTAGAAEGEGRGQVREEKQLLTGLGSGMGGLGHAWQQVDPDTATALDSFLERLEGCASGRQSFTLELDDPAGNSFIENPHAPAQDPLLSATFYDRTSEQNEAMGFLPTAAPEAPPPARWQPTGTLGAPHLRQSIAAVEGEGAAAALARYTAPEEVMVFPGHCPACGGEADQRMFPTTIPYFKEVIVMACSCDNCGYRSSELKAGGRIPSKGRRIALRVKSVADLSRDVIKSDTASVAIPEVDLELTAGTLGGRVTTVEGLLQDIARSLREVQGFSVGDSGPEWKRQKWKDLDERLTKLGAAEEEWTLILDDAMANSFIAPAEACESIEEDMQLTSEEYERSWDQEEDMGLHHMRTERGEDGEYEE